MSAAAIELAVREAGLKELSSEAVAQFGTYLELLVKWNSKMNLTATREPEAIIRRHFIECIQCAQALPNECTLLDFGSGAGLPGIPISICRPEIRVTLGESQRKKAAFLQEIVRSLGLNSEVFDGRIEEMPESKRFSIVTVRAVDKMADACQSALLHMATRGCFVLFATKKTEAGLKAALPEIEWQQTLPVFGLDNSEILLGRGRE